MLYLHFLFTLFCHLFFNKSGMYLVGLWTDVKCVDGYMCVRAYVCVRARIGSWVPFLTISIRLNQDIGHNCR